jgi:CRP-like cAMP-binding protein
MAQLQALWGADKYMGQLAQPTIGRMKGFLNFCLVPPDQEFIRQDEHGDYMAVLLKGRVAVERTQSWGERLRLAEVVPGEMLGEMSLLDGGVRFSSCVTRSRCELAVLTADAMNRMLVDDADLVAGLMTLMARKMSLRLRVVGARLSDRI